MKVTISVENGDQEVEVSRSQADIVRAGGSIERPNVLGAVLDLAVADTRRALNLPEAQVPA